MIRIAHSGDWHVDEHNRFQETVKVLNWFCEDVAKQRPDLITIGGDSAPVSVRPMTPVERNELARVYQQLAEIAPVFIVRGNHDCADSDIDIFSQLKSKFAIQAFSAPAMINGLGAASGHPFIIAALPWPSKGFLMSRARVDGVKLEDVNETCRQAMKAILLQMRVHFENATPAPFIRILLSHLNVTGADIGGFALVGQDIEVGSQDLEATGADAVLLSHIHKRQSFGPRVHYPGSIRRVDFGEEGEEKGYIVLDVEQRKEPLVQFRQAPLPAMQTIRISVSEFGATYDTTIQEGADARLIIEVDEERRATIDEQHIRDLVQAGSAHSVKVEYRVTPKQRVRAPEMKEARTDADRLCAWLKTLSPEPDEITAGRLLLKLVQIAGGAA